MASSDTDKDKKPQRKWTIEEYEQAIRKAQGFVSVVAQLLGVTPRAVNKRIKGSKVLQAVMRECREFTLDVAESKLLTAVNASNLTAVFYYLNNMGKKRGYGRKWWEDGPGPEDGEVKVTWIDEKPPRGKEEDEEAGIDLEALGVEGKLTPEDLGLNGKGAKGKGERVNGDD